MKRIGFLFDKILDRENLLLAFKKASKGKASSPSVIEYSSDLEKNITDLYNGLKDLSYPVGNYNYFKIFDPKERMISSVPFSERVLHHAIMNICTPFFERFLIYDSYANCNGKGQFKAISRAQKFAHEYKWFLKCDIKKYFDSIPHDKLYALLERKFKDSQILAWFKKLIESYSVNVNRGLPIGNLSSQHFANLYLDRIDRIHFPYVRYMDDFVFWSNDKNELKNLLKRVQTILECELGLSLKENSYINQTKHGMDFLGMRIFPNIIGLSRASKFRYKRKLIKYKDDFENNILSEYKYHESIKALTAFTNNCTCSNWRRNVIDDLGLYV